MARPEGLALSGADRRSASIEPEAFRDAAIREANGASGRARTFDPRLRRPVLYPPELRTRAPMVAGLRFERAPAALLPAGVFVGRTVSIQYFLERWDKLPDHGAQTTLPVRF